MSRSCRLLVLLAAASCLAAAAMACSKDNPSPTPEPPTLITGASSRPQPPTPVPTPALTPDDLVAPQWQEISEADLPVDNFRSVLLEVATGRFYLPGPAPARDNAYGIVSVIGWLPSGEAILEVGLRYNQSSVFEEIGALYAALPGSRTRKLTDAYPAIIGGGVAVSRQGLMALHTRQENLLVDWRTGRRAGSLPGPDYSVGAWSPDGTLLSMPGRSDQGNVIGIWDSRDGSLREIEDAESARSGKTSFAAWSNRGHKLAYRVYEPGNQGSTYPLRVRDLDTGADYPAGLTRGEIAWSLDDRYLAYSTTDGFYSFAIYDTLSGYTVTLTAAVLGGWLDARTLYFLGNACGEETLFTIRGDGTGWRTIVPLGWYFSEPRLSPNSDTIAFNTLPARSDKRSVSLASISGAKIVGQISIKDHSLRGEWSLDGRFLVTESPLGRDACLGPPQVSVTEVR